MQSRIRQFYDDVEDIPQVIEQREHDDQPQSFIISQHQIFDKEESRDSERQREKQKQLLEAIDQGDAKELATAIEWALLENCKGKLTDDINAARIKLKELQNQGRARQSFYSMRPGLISELRSYSNPPKVVYDVMTCVYLLLGMKRHQINTWSAIQALLSSNGQYKLKKRIEICNSSEIPKQVTTEVREILSKYDFQSVYLASEGAAAFYTWIQEILGNEEQLNLPRLQIQEILGNEEQLNLPRSSP